MKVLLAQQSVYVPTFGGANKANRLLLESLVDRGHHCEVICPATKSPASDQMGFRRKVEGVVVHAIGDRSKLLQALEQQIAQGNPDWVLVSSEDPGQLLLERALAAAPKRVVYIAHTTLVLPFGPGGFVDSSAKTDLLARCAGLVTVSDFMREYIRRYGGMEARVFQPPLYGEGSFRQFDNAERGNVLLINPCDYKGLPILEQLAEARPNLQFGAVPTWGTTASDRSRLARYPNIQVIQPQDQIEKIFADTRILLVPSLWYEAFGRVCVEAMLHGIPVMAAKVGGLPEAKLGIDYILPVEPIKNYTTRFDGNGLPGADVPEQNVAPWLAALDRLVSDTDHYRDLAEASRQAAHSYLASLSINPFLDYLETLQPGQIGRETPTETPRVEKRQKRLHNLSPEQRALLLKKIKQKRG